MADYLAKLGCTEAMNLDGGASSQLLVDGQVMNSPSAGRERATATGLVLMQKKTK
jgi:exopolysaccharide biosynthesis protein